MHGCLTSKTPVFTNTSQSILDMLLPNHCTFQVENSYVHFELDVHC